MVTVAGGEHLLCEYCSFTIQQETLMNPHFNSFDEINLTNCLTSIHHCQSFLLYGIIVTIATVVT